MGDAGIDGIIVINLDRRPDRWAEFQADWQEILPWARVVRLSASDGRSIAGFGQRPWFRGRKRDLTWAGRAGCALSHGRALREAQARGWRRVLILEDDAVPAVGGRLPAILAQADWDMLYLGASKPQNADRHPRAGVARISGALDTHAYAVTAPLRDWLIEQLPTEATVWAWIAREGAVDRWMRREIGRRFSIALCQPIYAGQRIGPSDITQRVQTVYGGDDAVAGERSNALIRNGERLMNALRSARRHAVGF
ncbi:glycosyl transferase [Brevundimonas sp. LM2]|uniref:glycosyl transferase n=1 Tax=Brevundimonas sp. LM2 TaxID=1938605 RepID=UPI00123758AD|nr:glycosyl transferase [Brevundimonas sp. LM2]